MKFLKTLLAIFIFTSFSKTLAQDVIVKNDKSEIKANIVEITEDDIKYKKFENPDGDLQSVNKTEVFMIIYQNGYKEYFETPKKETVVITEKTAVINSKDSKKGKEKATKIIEVSKPLKVTKSNKETEPAKEHITPKITKTADIKANQKNWSDGLVLRFAAIPPGINDIDGFGGDINIAYEIKHNINLGLGAFMVSQSIEDKTQTPEKSKLKTIAVYPFVSYKREIVKGIHAWASAGYIYKKIANTDLDVNANESGFSWQVGGDYFFGDTKKLGATLYTYEAKIVCAGAIYRF